MNAREFKTARRSLGLSVQETATLFRVNADQVRRWETPKTLKRARDIPRGVELTVRLMLDSGVPDWLKEELRCPAA